MPELPEVETVKTGLEKAWVGKTVSKVILRRENLRYPFPENFSQDMEGQKIIAVRRRAKYLLIDTDGDLVFLSHLGMSGKYTLFDAEKVSTYDLKDSEKQSIFGEKTGFNGKHDHMEIRFDDGSISVYTDPRRFGIVKLFHRSEEPVQSLLEVLGPEPFDDWNSQIAADRCKGKRSPIKTTLLDQRFVVGVGNIYACEALHQAGISPTKQAYKLVTKRGKPTKALDRLVDEVKIVLKKAIAAGGSTLNDFADVEGNLGYFSHHFTIYGREDEPCLKPDCGGIVERIVQSNRSTFLCPRCQK
tara:strand:+ start:349 stop:1251 length:903 start_codon:yes stop_codon:yes gene_type:complete